jgi:hypothetical protein
MTWMYVLAIIVVAGLLYWSYRSIGRTYLRFRGTRVITCPETSKPAAVRLDAQHAALTAALKAPHLRLSTCTRWPERKDCGQECLRQIEASPESCLVKNMLTAWFADKSCVYCRQPLGAIDWAEHKPALQSPEGKTAEWEELVPENLPAILATHQAVCWNCHIAESFRREHPELVLERPFRK